MGFAGVLAGMSVAQGVTSISQGYAQSAESKYNASLYQDQAQAIAVQGSITQGQYTAKAGKMAATQTAIEGAAGIEPTGSAAAVMVESQRNILTDMAISQYNTTMAENSANASATNLKIQASQEVDSGYSTAFSDVLKGASNYALAKGSFNLK